MSRPSTPGPHGRSPWLAVILSLAATGLGHIYCGRLAKGLMLFFAGFAFAPIIVLGMQELNSMLAIAAAAGSIGLLLAIYGYALIDAYSTARRSADRYQLREYNRWYIYLMFIVVAFTYPTTLSQSIRIHLLQAYRIPSASMAPNILQGDHLLLNKAIYNRQGPRRGEVVIFVHPNLRHQHYIKRVAALPGDTVAMEDGRLWVNGRLLTARPERTAGEVAMETQPGRSYRVRIAADAAKKMDFAAFQVPNGHCFVLGDNRSQSLDSRHFGPIPLADVLGRVDFIYWPAESRSRFGGFRS